MGAFGKTPKSIRFPRHPIQFHQTPQSEAFLAQPIERNAIPPAPHGRPRRPPKACCSFTIFFCFVTEFFFNFTKRGTCYGVRWKGGVRGTPSLVPLREHTHTHRQRDRERERERERAAPAQRRFRRIDRADDVQSPAAADATVHRLRRRSVRYVVELGRCVSLSFICRAGTDRRDWRRARSTIVSLPVRHVGRFD